MTTADWALAISCGSLVIAAASFVWNVWSRFIYPKPRLKVAMTEYASVGLEHAGTPWCIAISATNHGPGPITLSNVFGGRRQGLFRRLQSLRFYLVAYTNWPYDNALADGPFPPGWPKKLEVGETASIFFPRNRRWFDELNINCIAITDSFSRNHWVRPSDIQKLRGRLMADPSLEVIPRANL